MNSLILYLRLWLITVFALLTTRYALKALGVIDFGLFSVLGSIISFIGVFNAIMLSTSNRFIAVAIGKGNIEEANEQFNINLLIHIVIAIFTLLVAIPIGDWYILNHVHFDGDINVAVKVFRYSIIGSAISFIGVPYNGLLMAKERFIVFSSVDVIAYLLKLIIAILIVHYFENKLRIYAIAQAVLTALPTLIYIIYCNRFYPDIAKCKFVRNKAKYKEVFSFSVWIGYGAVATIGKAQGAALLVNAFFNTVMNTALGIANSVNSMLTTFAQSVTQPIAPQITKCYAAGNKERYEQLLIISTKLSFMIMLLVSSPFLLSPDWIFNLWLGQVPPYVIQFTLLLIIDALVGSLNSGISSIIFASGKIKFYQLSINTLRFFAIIAAYFVLKLGNPAYSLLCAYIVFSILIFFVGQWVLHKTLKYDNMSLIKKSYLPSLLIIILFVPFVLLAGFIPPVLRMAVGFIYVLILEAYIGFKKEERIYLYKFMKSFILNR